MARIDRFEDIDGWTKGRELRQLVYGFTRRGEFAKDFSLKDQIRRSAQSVTSNIAEGFERGGNREFIQFLSDAKSSCGEVRDQLYTALDEKYVAQAEFTRAYDLAVETSRLISGFMKYLQQSDLRGSKFKRGAGTEKP
jgi:four helix bundle protein